MDPVFDEHARVNRIMLNTSADTMMIIRRPCNVILGWNGQVLGVEILLPEGGEAEEPEPLDPTPAVDILEQRTR